MTSAWTLSIAMTCIVISLHPAAAAAQNGTADAAIARAMEAAPARITANATIVDSTGKVLRAGSNGWVSAGTTTTPATPRWRKRWMISGPPAAPGSLSPAAAAAPSP